MTSTSSVASDPIHRRIESFGRTRWLVFFQHLFFFSDSLDFSWFVAFPLPPSFSFRFDLHVINSVACPVLATPKHKDTEYSDALNETKSLFFFLLSIFDDNYYYLSEFLFPSIFLLFLVFLLLYFLFSLSNGRGSGILLFKCCLEHLEKEKSWQTNKSSCLRAVMMWDEIRWATPAARH